MAKSYKTYAHETRDKMNRIFERCLKKVNDKVNPCTWLCSKCRLSDEYQKITGTRLEEIHE